MVEPSSVGQIQNLSSLILSNNDLQIQLIILVVGLVTIFSIYFKFANWIRRLKFSYTRPHLSRFIRKAILPFFALALISTTNFYIQIYDLFDESEVSSTGIPTVKQTFAKILNSINILIIGYTVSQLVPIILQKHDSDQKEREDFENWKTKRGFPDDPCGNCDVCRGNRYGICENTPDLYHKFFKWIPPTEIPPEFTKEEFQKYMNTEEGRRHLENYRVGGMTIGSYQEIIKDPFKKWKEVEREKYERYLNLCLNGNNASGRILSLKVRPREIYSIDDWMEVKRLSDYEYVVPGGKPPGYFEQKQKSMPRSVNQILPIGIFIATILGVITWWGVDLVVVATATGGLGVGVGLALKQTMENYFAYLIIRKNKTIQEGDRVQLSTGFNGYVHSITPGVTYIRHALNESLAIIPTNQLINEQILNFTKEFSYVPATVKVGVSYLNDPKQVAAILIKVGKLTMLQSKDEKGRHLVIQKNCPYLEENQPSCGCDKNALADIDQPVVRFEDFNESSLDFTLWVYAKDYGSQFKVKTDMRMIMYEEFKKYDIRIPWPIRTIYQGDEKRESEEISKLDKEREKIKSQFGVGDISLDENK
ncbi:MAG: mechanosensitive ion channel domain-containing protein [Nitrososphaera sp.]|jgi:small-conductance mechanosensitive channel